MNITFDITEEELPIFLAEAEDQLQILDEGLVRLEQDQGDSTLLQAIFRAAHTLKGSAGMIGHKRMVELTHTLEAALDGLRKGTLNVTVDLIDACLESIDVLRILTDEISQGETSPVEIAPIVEHISSLSSGDKQMDQWASPELIPGRTPEGIESGAAGGPSGQSSISITAAISPDSIASAARAFQIMMALQELGEIVSMEPSQAQIETAAPVQVFKADFIPCGPLNAGVLAEIHKRLGAISEIDDLVIAEQGKQKQKTQQNNLASSLEHYRSNTNDKTVRTSVERLDNLMNLVGELITDRNRLYLIRGELDARFRGEEQVGALSETITHVGRITDQLQAEVMGIRMLPVSNVFNKFPRMVRDLSRKARKQVDLVMRGGDTELDRSVIEEISDPLIHLLRNAVDHGIELPADRIAAGKPERGIIQLTARHEQGRIMITVEDNGQGINVKDVVAKAIEKGQITRAEAETLTSEEAIDLIFISGLSTAKVVSDVSGRGVGMDIVRNNIERLNGSILVETWPGRGTQFQIVLPLTLAIVPTLLVRLGNGMYAIPLVTVTETLRVSKSQIQTVKKRPVILLRDRVLPLIRLSDAFGIHHGPNGHSKSQHEFVVVVRAGKTQMGLVVDALVGEQEVVVKSLGTLVGDTPGISSAAILGDGQIALIVDVQGLFKLASQSQSNI